MFPQKLRARVGAGLKGDGEAGFTLIELLVVMVILGILAAIALPAFLNQRDKPSDAKAKVYAHTAEVAMETYATEHNGEYSGASEAALEAIEATLKSAFKIHIVNAEAKKYELYSESTSGHKFYVENNEGALSFKCTPKETGGCPSTESWANG